MRARGRESRRRTATPLGWRLVRASGDGVPASVRRFNQRARQRRMRAAAPWLALLALLGCAGLVAWVGYGTALFGVDRVLVQGVSIASPDDVRAAAAIRPGTPMARVDLAEAARRVGTLAPVRHARLVRDWPGTVIIEVQERVAVAAVPARGGFDLVDGAGVVFDRREVHPAGLPLVRLASPGPRDPATRAALTVLAALPPPLRDVMQALVADAPTRIRLELAGGRKLIWGDAASNAEKARVAVPLLAKDVKVIDVSAPGVVTMR